MQSNRPRDTIPEVVVRSALHMAGLRFRKHARPLAYVRCEADLVFRKARLAVFIDGCFWHGCPEHATFPVTNGEWWAEKLSANRVRDRANDDLLQEKGWTVLRFWEHEAPEAVVRRVTQAIREASLA